MNLGIKILLITLTVLTLNSCTKESDKDSKPKSSSINKIMPLGASRVEGYRPEYESYRYELWKDLSENGWTFDYIGTQSDEADYPLYNGDEFDIDHEGRGGWTSGQILNELNDWLNDTGSPDIVLFSSPGGNDALSNLPYEEAKENINGIIDILQAKNPNVTIIIEQMAPGHSDIMNTQLTNYFIQLQQEVINIANNQTTSNSKVVAVDMYSGFNDTYLADDVHYNEAGAEFIANRYYNVLESYLTH